MKNKFEKSSLEFFNYVKDETLKDFVNSFSALQKQDLKKNYDFINASFEKNYHAGYKLLEKAIDDYEKNIHQINQNPPEKKK